MIEKFGNEYSVLLKKNRDEIAQIANDEIAELIIKMRNNEIKVAPGYDGVYGRIELNRESEKETQSKTKVSYIDEYIR